MPVGTIGTALGGILNINCTDHLKPCCWPRLGIKSNLSIWIKSLSTLTGAFNMQQNPNIEFGLKGGAAARLSKNFSII